MGKTKINIFKAYQFNLSSLDEIEKKFIIELQFMQQAGYRLDLENPKGINEKIQWLKLYYKDDLMIKCTDKVLVRNYIKERIGEKYLVNCIGIYNNVNEIDFNKLPNKFVLKVNWGSGQNIICQDKTQLDIKKAKSQLIQWLRPESNHYYRSLEWCYKDIDPKILCEEYIENSGDLVDYKFFCYNGKPKHMFIVQNRSLGHNKMTIDFFDMHYNWLPFKRYYDNAPCPPDKPKKWQEMVRLAKILSQPFPFVRVDFYENYGQLKVGELTFYPGNGTEPFYPREWDFVLGQSLILPQKTKSSQDATDQKTIDGRLVERLITLEGRYGSIATIRPHKRRMSTDRYPLKYAQYMKNFIHTAGIVLVESNISCGTGLAMWSDLFKHGTVVGLYDDPITFRENEQKLRNKGAFKNNNLRLFKFNQLNNIIERELQIFLESQKIDIFIDSGCSSDEKIIRTMLKMKSFLKNNFVYIVEHASKIQPVINHIFKSAKIDHSGDLVIITSF